MTQCKENPDISKAMKHLNWKPKISRSVGLKTYDWFKNNYSEIDLKNHREFKKFIKK